MRTTLAPHRRDARQIVSEDAQQDEYLPAVPAKRPAVLSRRVVDLTLMSARGGFQIPHINRRLPSI